MVRLVIWDANGAHYDVTVMHWEGSLNISWAIMMSPINDDIFEIQPIKGKGKCRALYNYVFMTKSVFYIFYIAPSPRSHIRIIRIPFLGFVIICEYDELSIMLGTTDVPIKTIMCVQFLSDCKPVAYFANMD